MNEHVTQSRVVLFEGAGKPLRHVDAVIAPLQAGEVLVRVLCTTMCGSDLHTFHGHRNEPTPCILGHEVVGRVEALGHGPTPLTVDGDRVLVGDRITWALVVSCGSCFFCTHELPQKCERGIKYGHQRYCTGAPITGGLSQRITLLAGTSILRVPDALEDALAASAMCAGATAAASIRIAKIKQGEHVLVQGAGLLGLTIAAMARQAGAASVFMVDRNEARLAQSLQFGVTHTLQPFTIDPLMNNHVAAVTAARGVDVLLECTGVPAATESALKQLRTGGRAVLVGAAYSARPLVIDAQQIVRRCLCISGIHNYAPSDLQEAIAFLAGAGAVYPFASLFSDPMPLGQIEAAMRSADTSTHHRMVVKP